MQRAAVLEDYLDRCVHWPFDWTSANCCHFVGRWIETAIGHDPMDAMNLRETPTAFDAKRLIVELGGLKAAWTQAMGSEPVSALHAQMGDVVLLDLPEGVTAVGVCLGIDSTFVDENGRLTKVPTILATCAWRLETQA